MNFRYISTLVHVFYNVKVLYTKSQAFIKNTIVWWYSLTFEIWAPPSTGHPFLCQFKFKS